jgi:hypothetical protein
MYKVKLQIFAKLSELLLTAGKKKGPLNKKRVDISPPSFFKNVFNRQKPWS